ncbi:acid protease [Ceraceosorus guamensis]|uniref:Acid protease n=1 Tax=Ceraceosorus guamensis TaxID=1522189 RepID=A0A316W3B4_9BASI|nr:acid protease [Ceraceosorus guamensis]PWN43091.1 acid protease [Ceraceosorus guamensis]
MKAVGIATAAAAFAAGVSSTAAYVVPGGSFEGQPLFGKLPNKSSQAHVIRDAPGGSVKLPLYTHNKRDRNNVEETKKFAIAQGELVRKKWAKYTAEEQEEREKLGKRQTIGLTGYSADVSYYAQVSIGTPPQNFVTILDTGSADFWVADSECTNQQCQGSALFNTAASSTYRGSDTAFQIQYGIGAVRGTLAADTVSLAGYVVQDQTFAIIDQLAEGTLNAPASALMGMGFETLASSAATPFWEVLAQSNKLSQPLFTFQLRRNNNNPTVISGTTLASQLQPGGVFTLGELDSNQYTGDITYTSLTSPAYWTIPIDSFNVNGQTTSVSSGSNTAAIDTGTTLIAGPVSAIRALYNQIPNSQAVQMDGGGDSLYWVYPCNTDVSAALTFGGKTWNINPLDFNYGLYGNRGSTQYCLGAFFATDLGGQGPQWIVGDAFLKNVFSVFESNPARVGFAALRGDNAQAVATTSGAIQSAGAAAATVPRASATSSATGAPAGDLPTQTNSITGIVGGSGLPTPVAGSASPTGSASLISGSNVSSGGGSGNGAGSRTATSATLGALVIGAVAGMAMVLA